MRYWVLVVLVGALVGVGALGEEPSPTPLIRGLASFVVPGLGQYLNGEYEKALTHFVVIVLVDVGSSYVAHALPYLPWWTTGALHTLWALYSAVDAYQTALELEGLTLELSPSGFALNF
ncbi:hypothetical protein H5T52_05715 [Candidatus Bipolaricaulota bacterium]|nr:hypothetical protein [Candidatus Bipolaricaulota bacterium]